MSTQFTAHKATFPPYRFLSQNGGEQDHRRHHQEHIYRATSINSHFAVGDFLDVLFPNKPRAYPELVWILLFPLPLGEGTAENPNRFRMRSKSILLNPVNSAKTVLFVTLQFCWNKSN